MPSPLVELNALLDNFVPLTKKVHEAKIEAQQKEADCLEKILLRVFLVMPHLHENGEVGQYALIDRGDEIPIGKDGGYRISNTLTLLEDGPRLVRSFTVEHWGVESPFFEINDRHDISCLDAIKTYGFEGIISGLVEMLKCQITMDSEYKELQSRIKQADSLVEVMQEKFVIECRQDENKAEEVIS